MIKVSVIIPVFNAEKYLDKVLDSVLSQSFTNVEIILVDDGSTDSSYEKCKSYSKLDNRIVVVHQENEGVSSARNKGIDIARGEWITFVDSDDYIGEQYFDIVNECNGDFVVYNHLEFNEYYINENVELIDDCFFYNAEELRHFFVNNLKNNTLLSPTGKFYKKSLIGNLRFTKGQRLGEDVIFVLNYLRKCSSLTIANNSIYYLYRGQEIDFCKRYQMPVEHAKWELNNIFCAYSVFGIENQEFVAFELELFRKVCSTELYIDSRKWYCDNTVRTIYRACSQYLGWKGRIKYFIFRNKYIYKILSGYLK